jgi:hypothetical protein
MGTPYPPDHKFGSPPSAITPRRETLGLLDREVDLFEFTVSMRKASSFSAASWKRRYVLAFFQKLPPCLIGTTEAIKRSELAATSPVP